MFRCGTSIFGFLWVDDVGVMFLLALFGDFGFICVWSVTLICCGVGWVGFFVGCVSLFIFGVLLCVKVGIHVVKPSFV